MVITKLDGVGGREGGRRGGREGERGRERGEAEETGEEKGGEERELQKAPDVSSYSSYVSAFVTKS